MAITEFCCLYNNTCNFSKLDHTFQNSQFPLNRIQSFFLWFILYFLLMLYHCNPRFKNTYKAYALKSIRKKTNLK